MCANVDQMCDSAEYIKIPRIGNTWAAWDPTESTIKIADDIVI